MLKTHNCGELRAEHAGQQVTLAGWIHRWREHGGLIFWDLRDRWGITQATINQDTAPEVHALAHEVRGEWVVQVTGTVIRRPAGMENTDLVTGAIELEVTALRVLNRAKTPPFYINKNNNTVDEALRMRYRYLDLRRPAMQRNLVLRHNVIRFIRNYLSDRGFIEIETPILFKTTPEGARDYLVPSRVHPGKFYALPQSPQQLKQLLMVAGYERYFQIARCFRDEDQRGDRQPEFTQLDLEMSFVEREDIMALVEELMTGIVEQVSDRELVTRPFPRLSHHDALEKYGTDKPDLRYGLELADVGGILKDTGFGVFRGALDSGGQVKALRYPGGASLSRKEIDDLTNMAKEAGAKGMAYLLVDEGGAVRSPIAKFLTEEETAGLLAAAEAEAGDLIAFIADKPAVVAKALDRLRREIGARLKLADPNLLAFCWITDFPCFEWDEEYNRWTFAHNPFAMPHPGHIDLIDSDPAAMRSFSWRAASRRCSPPPGRPKRAASPCGPRAPAKPGTTPSSRRPSTRSWRRSTSWPPTLSWPRKARWSGRSPTAGWASPRSDAPARPASRTRAARGSPWSSTSSTSSSAFS